MKNKTGSLFDPRLLMVLLIFAALVLLVVTSKVIIGWDFRNNLWGPAYLLTQGKSPYGIEVLFDLGNAVWMPMMIGAFFPLGLIPLQQASNIWFLVNFLCLALMVWISAGTRRPPVWLLAICITLCVLFPPSISHFWLGQATLLTTLIFLVVVFWEDRIPLFWSAFLIAIGLSKPQLAVLILPGLIIHELKAGGLKRAFLFIALIFASILILTLPLFLAYPHWFTDFIRELNKNPSWAQPSSLNILRSITPRYGNGLWVLLAMVIFGINIWLWTRKTAQAAVLWSLALTPLATPYVWTWDFVMVLPLFVHLLFQIKSRWALMMLFGGYIAAWLVIANMKFHGLVGEDYYWWIPWYLMAVILLGRHIEKAAWQKET